MRITSTLFLLLWVGAASAVPDCDDVLSQATASTVRYYDANAAEYARLHSGSSPSIDRLREEFASGVRPGGRVLDLGCGPGRDSLWFLQRGFDVVPVDASSEMVRLASENLGVPATVMLAQDLQLETPVDGVWAMASLIHVPIAELENVFEKIADVLKPGGVLHASFIEGIGTPDVGEIVEMGRYFSRVSEATTRSILARVERLEIDEQLSQPNEDDFHGERKPTATFRFYNIVARKKL